jgi:Icc protein
VDDSSDSWVGAEITTVADDEIVAHLPAASGGSPARVLRLVGLMPASTHNVGGASVTTLARPPGELLTRFATVNDLHFGETRCGYVHNVDVGPVLTSDPGEPPYPAVMNAAAAGEIAAAGMALVVAKGDLTDAGSAQDLADFEACYSLSAPCVLAMPGNHDVSAGPFARPGLTGLATAPPRSVDWPALPAEVVLDGVVLALVDTTVVGRAGGALSARTLEWLDELGSRADRPVVVIGHHHAWDPSSTTRPTGYFGIEPSGSEALVEVFARRPRLCAYLAGHTHRNRARRFNATGDVPWVEVASVKEYPGCWAEYRVFEGGILQILRRVGAPTAMAWAERTRSLYEGTFAPYAFGRLEDRCFAFATAGTPVRS